MANLSKIKREKMLDYLEKLKEINNDDESIRAITEIENALNEKKYGLVWEEHSEKVDEELVHNIPIFVEDENRKITANEDEPYNFLLEGDNLHSLKLLEKTHKGMIDIIYIDPPYNTGNKDFIYDDHFVDKKDGYSHSKWLSFMEKRLKIAKELLKKDGIILVSIDKNEGFQLKLLMDSIFGEDSFAADLHVETSIIGGPRRIPAMQGSVVKTTEFIFGYTNGNDTKIMRTPKYDYLQGYDTHYSLFYDEIEDNLIPFVEVLKRTGFVVSIFDALDLAVSLKNLGKVIDCSNKIREWLYSDKIAKNLFRKSDDEVILPENYAIEKKNTVITYNGKKCLIDNNASCKILFSYADRIGKCDDYFSNYGERAVRGNLWKGFSSDGGNLAKEGKVSFKNGKKPIRLIKQLIDSVENCDSITVLDFFAGSGTTGHAVIQLNKEDGGNRKYILCTNNENNICEEVTYQRLKNIQEELPHNLKYYKTEFIPKFSDEEDSISDKMMEHIKELIELEHHIELDGKKYLILEDEDKLAEAIEKIENNGSLFVRSGIFLSRSNQRILDEKQVNVIEIPEYYFRDELKEVGEL